MLQSRQARFQMLLGVFVLQQALLIQEGQCIFWPVKLEHSIRPRQAEIPAPNNFWWRGLERIAVLGNYLYIDGGEISQFVNEEADSMPSRPVNITESIPLSQPWTNATVTFKSIDKTAPDGKTEALWVDLDSRILYAWGGEGPYGNTTGADNIKLWAFSSDNEGCGSWAAAIPDNPAVFDVLLRGTVGSAATCNGVGFLLGGVATPASDARVSGTVPLPGLLTYNMKSSTWANVSATFPYATVQGGQAECLPFGPNGMVVFLGGAYSSVADGDALAPVPLNNLTFYDPVTNEWFWQLTGGEVPDYRSSFCSVGLAGRNGTFEIFIYGGYDSTANPNVLSDVWVLSLPGFQWFRSSVQGTPRMTHACAGIGKRQMIVVGGVHTYTGEWTGEDPPADPWAQGLGILDLPSLSWSDQYGSEASPYNSLEVVMNWYSNGSLASVNWVDTKVKSMFVNASTPSSTSAQAPGHTGFTPTSSSALVSGNTKLPTSAIVGGMIGGIAFLALICGAIFYCRRVSRTSISSSQDHGQQYGLGQKAELDTEQSPQYIIYPPQELSPDHMPPQLHHHALSPLLHELPTSERGYPMYELNS